MKIAYLLKKFPRLSETFVLGEILQQEARGTEVHVFSRRKPDDEPRHPQLATLRAPVEVLPHSKEINPWQEVFPGGTVQSSLLESIRRAMQELDGVEIARFPSLLTEAIYLVRRTRELGIEHVHVHFATDSAITAMLLQDLGGPTYSITAHAKDIYRSTVDPRLLERLIERSAFVVTVCDANVRWIEGMVSTAAVQRVRRLYNGIDLDAFSTLDRPRESDSILAVGRLVEKKGFDVLLKSLALLRDREIPFTAKIVGDGDQRDELHSLRSQLQLENHVDLCGPMDQAAVREEMSRATVFCLPCVHGEDGNRDALPTVLLEALAVGLPCISTPVTGIPEILGFGECGVLVEERDVEGTASALESLLGDSGQRQKLADAGVLRAAELFDGRKAAATLSEWFHEIPQRVAH